MDFTKLKELFKDNEVALKELNELEKKAGELLKANTDLVKKAEFQEFEMKTAFSKRDELKSQLRELQTKLDNTPKNEDFEKQIEKVKSEYEKQLNEIKADKDKIFGNYTETLKKSRFADLNLATKLPKDWDEKKIKSAIEFMQFDLSKEGLEFDTNLNDFVFKKDGVALINPNTAKPYTLNEMAETKLKSGNWDAFIQTEATPNGTNRGNVGSGTPKGGKMSREQFEGLNPKEQMDFIQNQGEITQ